MLSAVIQFRKRFLQFGHSAQLERSGSFLE